MTSKWLRLPGNQAMFSYLTTFLRPMDANRFAVLAGSSLVWDSSQKISEQRTDHVRRYYSSLSTVATAEASLAVAATRTGLRILVALRSKSKRSDRFAEA